MGSYNHKKSKMPQTKAKVFDNIDFGIFGQEMTETLQGAIEKYWEKDIKISLQSVNDFRELREEKIIKGLDFFSSRIMVESHKPIIFRLSKEFIDSFFDTILLKEVKLSKLENLTKLELKILNNFCEFVYKKLNTVLLSPNNVHLTEKSETTVNLIYLVEIADKDASYIVVSLPLDRINFKQLPQKTSFKDEDFLTSYTSVKIKAGDSKITLEELKNLMIGDIVLLENSSADKLILISGDFEKPFNIKADSSLILNIEEDTNKDYVGNNNEVTMGNNLWDDIQIEINAEFEKVKMTIGELKQITQGQIVDLGSVFDNEISLFVEDKKVAVGELLIVNNRYAVKLNKIITPNANSAAKKEPPPHPQKAPLPNKPQAKPQPRPQPRPQPQAKPTKTEDEEFDYSDFEK